MALQEQFPGLGLCCGFGVGFLGGVAAVCLQLVVGLGFFWMQFSVWFLSPVVKSLLGNIGEGK